MFFSIEFFHFLISIKIAGSEIPLKAMLGILMLQLSHVVWAVQLEIRLASVLLVFQLYINHSRWGNVFFIDIQIY